MVEETVIVEIKALKGLDNSHIAQVIGYLAVSGSPLDLLINFGERSLKFRRILPPRSLNKHRANRQWLFIPIGLSVMPMRNNPEYMTESWRTIRSIRSQNPFRFSFG